MASQWEFDAPQYWDLTGEGTEERPSDKWFCETSASLPSFFAPKKKRRALRKGSAHKEEKSKSSITNTPHNKPAEKNANVFNRLSQTTTISFSNKINKPIAEQELSTEPPNESFNEVLTRLEKACSTQGKKLTTENRSNKLKKAISNYAVDTWRPKYPHNKQIESSQSNHPNINSHAMDTDISDAQGVTNTSIPTHHTSVHPTQKDKQRSSSTLAIPPTSSSNQSPHTTDMANESNLSHINESPINNIPLEHIDSYPLVVEDTNKQEVKSTEKIRMFFDGLKGINRKKVANEAKKPAFSDYSNLSKRLEEVRTHLNSKSHTPNHNTNHNVSSMKRKSLVESSNYIDESIKRAKLVLKESKERTERWLKVSKQDKPIYQRQRSKQSAFLPHNPIVPQSPFLHRKR
ncbi:hypothetical protein BDB01DRAFT_835127 [Pilobolus umbonatus]|nr:hypothetical protein BDB01DRAFT_835127 [Pilobolus umbonatus]